MDRVYGIAGPLNRVVAYYNKDSEEIDGSAYHSVSLGVSQKTLMDTKCSSTEKTLRILFDVEYGEVMSGAFDSLVLPDAFTVAIQSDDINSPSHIFMYIDGYVYHSYAMKYTLKCQEVKKDILKKQIGYFLTNRSPEMWKAITGVEEKSFSGTYSVVVYKIASCNTTKMLENARMVLDKSLMFLKKGEGEYSYDDYIYPLTFDGETFNLVSEGIAFVKNLLRELK